MAKREQELVRAYLSWAEYGQGSRHLAEMVAESGYRPDLILAIARGGLLVGGALSYSLQVKNVFLINVEYYTGVGERLEFPVLLPPPLDLVDLRDTRVLVADDVADTGQTLSMVTELCRPAVAELRSAVLYQKPHSIVHPDYVWRRTDRWIEFPWSTRSQVVLP
ncbi:MAG TPA: phosphoribosyltransferase [Actinomycetota bacterium]|nr:phosphoribosyltransferase [Actinomycetota bacterium]